MADNKNQNDDILKEIPDEQLPTLRDLFKGQWPYALHAYYWVDNYIDWKKRNITKIKFYCPEGRWDDGTFIAIEDEPMHTVFLFTLEKSCNRLRNGLSKTSEIRWREEKFTIFFLAIHEDFQPTIMNELEVRGITVNHRDISNMWWIPKAEASKYEYDIPEEVYLAPLKKEDVETIDAVWPHRGTHSKFYLSLLITANGGFGLYLKTDDTLCSWIMRNNYGGMAILQTAEEHKRKGYGVILAKHFSKYWADKGLDIFCFIMTHNTPSLNLFQKLGYRKAHGITWTHCTTN